jgi:ATP-dependent DNA helicase RecG
MSTSIESYLGKPESQTLEFKLQAAEEGIARSVTAMLNAEGGMILLGMDNTGHFIGLSSPQTVEPLMTHLEQAISPKVPLRVERVEYAGKQGALIEVPRGSDVPYVHKGAIYIRTGAQNRAATAEQVRALLGKREDAEQRWERVAAYGIEPDSLPRELLRRTAKRYGERYGQELTENPNAWDCLERLNLTADLWPTRGAVALFQRDPLPAFPQFGIHATGFTGESKRETSEDVFFQGDLHNLLERAYDFCMDNLPRRTVIAGVMRRDTAILPSLAVREALVNALMHRDYADRAQVQVRILPSRLEVWNPGKLDQNPSEASVALRVSRPTNPDIARVCSVWGLAELLGAGLERIQQAMQELGLPTPQWRNVQGGVLLTLAWKEDASLRDAVSLSAFNERMLACLGAVKTNAVLTREEYTQRFAPDQAERSARNDLAKLVSLGYFRAMGGGRGTAYLRTDKPSPI